MGPAAVTQNINEFVTDKYESTVVSGSNMVSWLV